MMRVFFLILIVTTFANNLFAQPKTRQELERERKQLNKEIKESEKLQEKIKSATKENLNTLIVVGRKAELQERVVDNVAKDLNMLENNITGIQRDINKYDKLLDTLRQEYAKSMVYAYKNRGNYEFLNFIFSAENFNDAVKRVAYLKSYRTFREMQGQNILRTQELRRKRLDDLGVTRQSKTATLTVQEQEMKKIAEQKAEQDRIVENLRKQGKSIEGLIAEKKKREAKINASIKAAIAKAIKEENDRQIAFAKAEKKKRDEALRAQAAMDKARKDAADKASRDAAAQAKRDAALQAKREADAAALARANAAKNNPSITKPPAAGTKPPAITKPPPVITKPPVAIVKPPVVVETPRVTPTAPVVEYANPSAALNASFERNKGALSWPVDNHTVITHFGPYRLPSGLPGGFNNFVSIAAPTGAAVKAVFDGEVILIQEMEYGKYFITIKHGIKYYTSYINVSSVSVRVGQEIKAGQQIGKVATNLDGIGAIDFSLAKENSDINPEFWLRR